MNPPNSLAEPRSYLGTAIMFGGASGGIWALLNGFLVPLALGQPVGRFLSIQMGTAAFFGVAFGLSMAALFRGETANVPADSEASFLPRLDVATAEIAYHPATRAPGYYTYKPSWQAGLIAGRVAVAIGAGTATIVGPRIYVRRLLKRL